MTSRSRLTGERPQEGVTPDSLLALHAAGYRAVRERVGSGRVVDIGCGEGFETATLLDASRTVTGVDYSPDAVRAARASFGAAGLKVEQMDALHLGFDAGSFDAAVSSHLIEHFEDPEAHVREMARVLADDGSCLILTPNAPNDFENPFHIHLFEADELRSLLERYFEEVWIGGVDAEEWVKADFAARRAKGNKVLRLDVFDLRHKIPRSWYIGAYTRLLPLAYRLIARGDSGGETGITVDNWFVTESADETTLVLFAVAKRPRRNAA